MMLCREGPSLERPFIIFEMFSKVYPRVLSAARVGSPPPRYVTLLFLRVFNASEDTATPGDNF